MSKSANAGELRTRVYFKRIKTTTNGNGYKVNQEVNVFGQDADENDIPAMCKWVNAHGNEVFVAMQLKLKQPATITTRYSPLLEDESLIVYCGTDPKPYEVVSIDNVEQRNLWLEIKVQRKVPAR
ncbi:MAG TPA: head-tail adaptor protein [Clostridia bacterium]|nr:head-tail adaptor protein [Clostridia bacterium]